MKGIILAGGTGSRLFPLTKVTNKHLLPVGKYPMIYYSIHKMIQAKIRNILIITGKEHMGDVVNLLGSGTEFGAEFTYKVQDDAGGIAQALGLAEDFIGRDKMLVILGDNIFENSIATEMERFTDEGMGARIFLAQVKDPQRFGVPVFEGSEIVRIDEKPSQPQSAYAVTGMYMYDANVFEIIKQLKPSNRGELEITDVNNAYQAAGKLSYGILEGWWTDAGTITSLAEASELTKHINLDFKV